MNARCECSAVYTPERDKFGESKTHCSVCREATTHTATPVSRKDRVTADLCTTCAEWHAGNNRLFTIAPK